MEGESVISSKSHRKKLRDFHKDFYRAVHYYGVLGSIQPSIFGALQRATTQQKRLSGLSLLSLVPSYALNNYINII
ncbi:hypothetical protein [Holospora curviuscula]|nr:hypothetical protein [Holospora curviuscula]